MYIYFILFYFFAVLSSGRHMQIYYVTQCPLTSLFAEFMICTSPFVQYVAKPV